MWGGFVRVFSVKFRFVFCCFLVFIFFFSVIDIGSYFLGKVLLVVFGGVGLFFGFKDVFNVVVFVFLIFFLGEYKGWLCWIFWFR